MASGNFVIGVDFGTDSVRAMIVDAHSGDEISTAIFNYPRWADQLYCDAAHNQFRQHPLDYIEGLESTVKKCLAQAGPSVRNNVRAISVDTTGSTPVAVDRSGTPLSLLPPFRDNPNAMFILWKDHTAVKEAGELNLHAERFNINYLQYVGGIYSSEWFWAKLLHILRHDAAVRGACYSWVEHCDWIPFLLTGGADVAKLRRGVCAAGHKALWSETFGGLPPDDFFAAWDPLLKGFTSRLFTETFTADQPAGTLDKQWAERLGLPINVRVGIGAFDCHFGAVGGQIEPYFLSKVMGTSTCDMMVVPRADMRGKVVRGICGQVDGSIIPGMTGLEAGQSAFGDTYAWFRSLLLWPIENALSASSYLSHDVAKKLKEEVAEKIIPQLSEEAAKLDPASADELALDWLNGRRTPDANQLLTGALTGLRLGSDAPRIFRALVEATCFGARAIVERFREENIPVNGLLGLGGVARKSPFIMQAMADIMNIPIRIHKSEQTCALGAAMFAATVAGLYPRVEDAMQAMGQGFDIEYAPRKAHAAIYDQRYAQYNRLGAFVDTSLKRNMHVQFQHD